MESLREIGATGEITNGRSKLIAETTRVEVSISVAKQSDSATRFVILDLAIFAVLLAETCAIKIKETGA